MVDPNDFVISRKRKKYRFALFTNLENCFELEEWKPLDVTRPITLEVGAGTALFAVEFASRYPQRQFIALDVKADRLQKGARLATEQGLRNISFVRARADQLSDVCAPGTVSELWLTFSDPFPKAKSDKHRLTHPRFLELYRNLLAPRGVLRLKTDNHGLFDWSLEQLVADGWHIAELSFDLHESTMSDVYKIMTTFETRYVADKVPIYFLSVTRSTS